METVSTTFRPECQICFHPFSVRRRPKLLGCGHTCCRACLAQIALDGWEIRCPWCRQVTHLSGLSVVQLPDDHEALVTSPVFIRLPDSSCYLLPLGRDEVTDEYEYKAQTDGRTQTVEDDEDEDREAAMKSSAQTGFCTVLMVALILIFLLAIVLHNMSCVSKRFSIISCG